MLITSKNGAKKTDIMYGANLSFGQLQKYLSLLQRKGLMNEENNNGKIRYKTSEKGRGYLEEYEKLNNLII